MHVTNVTYVSSFVLPLKFGTGRISSSLLDHPWRDTTRMFGLWYELGEKLRTANGNTKKRDTTNFSVIVIFSFVSFFMNRSDGRFVMRMLVRNFAWRSKGSKCVM